MAFEIKDNVVISYTPEENETTVVIPEGVTEIGEGAFRGKANIEHVILIFFFNSNN